MLRRLDLSRLRNLGFLVLPAVALPLAGLGAEVLSSELPGGGLVAVAHATKGPAKLEPTPFKVKPFQVELPIPPVLHPDRVQGNTEFFEVPIEETKIHIPGLPDGLKTTIWGFDGQFPGPTIKARRGHPQVVRFINQLPKGVGDECCTIHRHGGDQAPIDDGHPADLFKPGATKDNHYPNDQRAATLWYHDHRMDITGRNVNMGLAGAYPISDAREEELKERRRLPPDDRDIPLTITDRLFEANGDFNYPIVDGLPVLDGFKGDVMLVNGAVQPFFEVATRKYMFRLFNMSNAREYDLRLSTGQPFIVVASEGGFLDKPIPTKEIHLVPAQRVVVVIDFSDLPVGKHVVLENAGGATFALSLDKPLPAPSEIMRFDVVRKEADNVRLPEVLDPNFRRLKEEESVRTREFVFERDGGRWAINKELFEPDRIDATVRQGDVEIIKIVNPAGGWSHPIHFHTVEYQILDRNGKPPRPEESGFVDMFELNPNDVVRFIGRFVGVPGAGPGHKIIERTFPFHCHNTEHEDHAMMGLFELLPH
jgi:FtsP/CotA-like multicopper oxidase with cupredoxin domain